MQNTGTFRLDNPRLGIIFVMIGMSCISVNDMLIKHLSGDYPLHQMVFVRSAIGICFSLFFVKLEGGLAILRTWQPGLHLLRGLLIVISNLSFFAALAVLPLADATTLFFVAPLFITLLSIPILGEKVGYRRIGAVLVGFLGVLIMVRPDAERSATAPGTLILLLPVLSALAYATMQILTRKLGVTSKASAMAVYIQATFIVVSIGFWLIAGDGRYAVDHDRPVLVFLLRAWVWPTASDWPYFALLGSMSAVIGYALAQAYRSADVATIAPFEYVALPLSIFWGWSIFGDVPGMRVSLGVALIAGSGIYVFLRERHFSPKAANGGTARRR